MRLEDGPPRAKCSARRASCASRRRLASASLICFCGISAASALLLAAPGASWVPTQPGRGFDAAAAAAATPSETQFARAQAWEALSPSSPDGGEALPPTRRVLLAAASSAVASLALLASAGGAARALVVGNKPPDSYGLGRGMGKKVKCTSRDECQEVGAVTEREDFGAAPSKEIQYQKTPSGARYKDLEGGNTSDGVAKADSTVQIRYRVMRSGKRSADGLSGEASTIFSLGYGEDDGPKDAVLTVPLGQGKFVKALDEGIVGMAIGGKRRVQVRPEYGLGWRKAGKCAEADLTVGAAVGLPGGGAEKQEACIQEDKLPQPVDFAAKRRFSRRFDESLIVEVELMGLGQK